MSEFPNPYMEHRASCNRCRLDVSLCPVGAALMYDVVKDMARERREPPATPPTPSPQ